MDEKRFKSCIMPLHKTLYAYALSILQDESDAADCMQDAFTRLWENRNRLEEISNVAAYATVTVRNIALSMASKPHRRMTVFGDDPPDIPDTGRNPGEKTEERENIQELRRMIDMLPENQRRVVMLSGIAGLSNSEIKKATGLSDDNVRVLLSRGRKKLRELFSRVNK
jgi:RNA polymerase sigma-70 factor (ECF subfamily)